MNDIAPGLYPDLDASLYHADAGVGSSCLKVFKRSPLHYWTQCADPKRVIPEPTPAQGPTMPRFESVEEINAVLVDLRLTRNARRETIRMEVKQDTAWLQPDVLVESINARFADYNAIIARIAELERALAALAATGTGEESNDAVRH